MMKTLRALAEEDLPLPGDGSTAQRHRRLFEIGRMDLSLARLAEAHWDAVAILAEAGKTPKAGSLYGVWASEKPGQQLTLERSAGSLQIQGKKAFCSGADLIDCALVTAGDGRPQLIEVDLRKNAGLIHFDDSEWQTPAFQATRTASAVFEGIAVSSDDLVGEAGWYLQRPGFWHGACGPASCWAGGAAGLVDYADRQQRDDPHTLAHLGSMHASVWGLLSYLESAGVQIDLNPQNSLDALQRALTVRHLVEQACTDILRRLPRAYGPYPLAMNRDVSSRYQELDLYLRQSHAERDLEALGRSLREEQSSGAS